MTSVRRTVGVTPKQMNALHHREEVMGTIVTIDVYADTFVSGDEDVLALSRARTILQRADTVFSTWRPDSPMSRLRRGEITLDQAPPEVAQVLGLCASARDITNGWFDPWAMPGGVDPTGYVKGWAAQNALDALVAADVSGVMVNAAGDIASFGGPEPAIPFRVGIVNPSSPGDLLCVVELVGAIATSGTYERGDHLIDPRSGRPSARVASASVTGPDLGLADALATGLVVAGEAHLAFIEPLEGYEALLVGFDGTVHWTELFPFASPVIPSCDQPIRR